VSIPSPSVSEQPVRRSRLLRPIRLSTFLLLVLVVALLIALYAYRVREARLQDQIAVYRHYRTEGIIDALEGPLTTTYADGAKLNNVLKDIKQRTTKNPKLPKIPNGIAIYVDPIGLQEAEKSMDSPVKRPPGADAMTLGEHLRRLLEPMGLGYAIRDGFLMITAKESIVDDFSDPYFEYRDVLK
jgi:hypothetical protein